jgi:dolichyl-phosphate beta-glucosyltransferase
MANPGASEHPNIESPRVSVVVPCYNGAPFILESLDLLLSYLREHPDIGTWEVVLVDDGSRDHTSELVAARFPEVRLIRHPRNRGKGAAVRTGMLAARGAFRFFTDADMPYDLVGLPKILHYLDTKEFHIGIGTRARPDWKHQVRPSALRAFTSAFFTMIVSRLVVTGIKDTQCGFKGFQAAVAEYLFSEARVNNFAFDVEILYLAFKNDLDVKRVPVRFVRDDVSTVSLLRHGSFMLLELLRIPFAFHGGRYRMMKNSESEPAAPLTRE